MQSPSHPHLLVFDQKWESNLTKTKVAQDWCLNNHNIVIRNWVPSKLCVLVATIKSLHKFCNLFPSSNTMLLITRRKNKLLTVLYVFYFCLLIAYKTSGYCTRIVVFIFLLISTPFSSELRSRILSVLTLKKSWNVFPCAKILAISRNFGT